MCCILRGTFVCQQAADLSLALFGFIETRPWTMHRSPELEEVEWW
jgi:hypothetical protein